MIPLVTPPYLSHLLVIPLCSLFTLCNTLQLLFLYIRYTVLHNFLTLCAHPTHGGLAPLNTPSSLSSNQSLTSIVGLYATKRLRQNVSTSSRPFFSSSSVLPVCTRMSSSSRIFALFTASTTL